MDCIQCQKESAAFTCSCLTFQRSSTDLGAQAMVREFSTGTENAGLCAACTKKLAFRNAKLYFRKPRRIFYAIWGALAAVFAVCLIIAAVGKFNGAYVFGAVAISLALFELASMGAFELGIRFLAAGRRSDKDRLLLARVESIPNKGIFIRKTYVPLDPGLYPDYSSFGEINSNLHKDNAKSVYERIIVPMQKGGIPEIPTLPVDFSDFLK